jgi:hypothetical protein
MLKLPKIKILQNIKHNEEVKKVNSDDKVNKDIINKKQIKINPKNSDPIHSNNKNSKLDIKNYINEHKNNPQNNNNIIYESSIKAVNNNEPNVNASQFQDFLKFNKKEVINNNKEFLIDFDTIKNENNNLKIKQPQNNLINEITLVNTIKINTLSSNMNKTNTNEKTLGSNNLISNPIPNNLINNNYQNYSINSNKTIHLIETTQNTTDNEKNDNNNNEINEKQFEKDLYDGQRYLIQISNLVENEQNEIDNDTIYNSDSFTNLVNVEELKEEDKITNSKNYKNDNKNNDNLTKSIITESGKKELNIEKKKLKKEFGKDFEKILNIFNENSNKKFFGYDENNIKSELLNQGFSNEIIEKVIKLAPEFFSLTVEKKMM